MHRSIATVSLSGTLPEKLEAIAAAGFDCSGGPANGRECHAVDARRSQAARPVKNTEATMAPPPTTLAGDEPRPRNAVIRYLSRFDDGEVMRWAFRGLLIGSSF